MTVLTGHSCGGKKDTKEATDDLYSVPKKEFVAVNVKDTETLVDNEVNDNEELPLPKTAFKPSKTKKKVTFDLPIDEERRWHGIIFKIIIALFCTLAVVSAGRYAVQRYQLYQWEKQFRKAHVNVMYQIKDNEFENNDPLLKHKQLPKAIVKNAEKKHPETDEVGLLRDMAVGNIEEWFSVGPQKWRLDSGEGDKNYSILTDAVTNYTVLLLTYKPKPDDMVPLQSPFYSVCYVTPSSALNLPHLQDISKFLQLVDQEAAMFVTKLSRSLYFNIGQPINVDISKYGNTIHEFCSGKTAYALEPLDVMDFLRRNMKRLVPSEGGEQAAQEIKRKVTEVVEKLAGKNKETSSVTPTDVIESVEEAVPKEVNSGSHKATLATTDESTAVKVFTTTQEQDYEATTQEPQPVPDATQKAEQVPVVPEPAARIPSDVGVPEGHWTMSSQGMEAPPSIVEGAQKLQQLNHELVQTLNSGNLLHAIDLMRQFDKIMAFLPCGNYNLHSPEGLAMNIHIRRQQSPIHGFMHQSMQVAGTMGLPGPIHVHGHDQHHAPNHGHHPHPRDEPRGFPEVVEVTPDSSDDVNSGDDVIDRARSGHVGIPNTFWGDLLGH